jgi:hypothetical protein
MNFDLYVVNEIIISGIHNYVWLYKMCLFFSYTKTKTFKDWSQFLLGLCKGVYNLIEVISNEPNK